MTTTLPRRRALQLGAAAGLGLVLPQARACEYFSSNLRILHPWTRAVAADAPFAIVCMKFDEVAQADRLLAVNTPVAESALLVGDGVGPAVDLAIPPGQTTALAEAGTQLRLVGLRHALEVARSYPLELVFEKGGRVNATLNVDFTSFRFG